MNEDLSGAVLIIIGISSIVSTIMSYLRFREWRMYSSRRGKEKLREQ